MIELLIALALAALTVLSAVPAGWYAFALAAPLIVAHTGIAEPFGRGGPYWQYHWERFRLARLPYLWGVALFAGLTAILIGLAVWGFLYNSPFARGALVGAWIADALLSHALLRAVFTGPNPGLRTALLYLLAAPCVLCWFTVDPLGVALGAAPFVAFHAVSWAWQWSGAAVLALVLLAPGANAAPVPTHLVKPSPVRVGDRFRFDCFGYYVYRVEGPWVFAWIGDEAGGLEHRYGPFHEREVEALMNGCEMPSERLRWLIESRGGTDG